MTQGVQRQDVQCDGPCSLGGVFGEFLYPLGLCVAPVMRVYTSVQVCTFMHVTKQAT